MKQKKLPKVCFHNTPLHLRREPHPLMFLVERSSFWIATLSVIAFLVGNMVGRHGWYTFWRSVWGEGSATIVYTGTVPPVAQVPDYVRWAQEYGGDPHVHTFRQIPQDLLVDLPPYDPLTQLDHQKNSPIGQIYSVGYMGSYATGGDGDGSHPAVDIRLPVGTPVQSIANGMVAVVKEDDVGFGTMVVIEHPNMPDPAEPRQSTTTLYSVYAHLSVAYVEEGMVVQKGERIALSGQSGSVSGPHLHFQIDRENAPWHPYWPFSTSEARKAGLSTMDAVNTGFHQEQGFLYTLNPMLYVQAQYVAPILVASADGVVPSEAASGSREDAQEVPRPLTLAERVARMRSIREERIRQRLARRQFSAIAQNDEMPSVVLDETVVIQKDTVVSASLDEQPGTESNDVVGPVATVSIGHDGSFAGRSWERIELTLLDAQGRVVCTQELLQDIYLRTVFGQAEFRPTVLRAGDFVNGRATVYMLPRGQRTVVVSVQPFNVLSTPMPYQR